MASLQEIGKRRPWWSSNQVSKGFQLLYLFFSVFARLAANKWIQALAGSSKLSTNLTTGSSASLMTLASKNEYLRLSVSNFLALASCGSSLYFLLWQSLTEWWTRMKTANQLSYQVAIWKGHLKLCVTVASWMQDRCCTAIPSMLQLSSGPLHQPCQEIMTVRAVNNPHHHQMQLANSKVIWKTSEKSKEQQGPNQASCLPWPQGRAGQRRPICIGQWNVPTYPKFLQAKAPCMKVIFLPSQHCHMYVPVRKFVYCCSTEVVDIQMSWVQIWNQVATK